MGSAVASKDTRGQVILGDVEYDGRVILYIIKGVPLTPEAIECLLTPEKLIRHPTSITSSR